MNSTSNKIDWDLFRSKIDAVIFDMDGVLIDADRLHYDALNMALTQEGLKITYSQHLSFFKGIPTRHKLRILEIKHNREPFSLEYINEVKQRFTQDLINQMIVPVREKIEMMKQLKQNGLKVAVASNSIRASVEMMLRKAGILEYVDLFISNEDIKSPKPAPDSYIEAMKQLDVTPNRTLVVEDSEVGRTAARISKVILCPVRDPFDVDLNRLYQTVRQLGKTRIVIPMAGHGSRFVQAGYNDPKPLIMVDGKPMIQRVVENVNCDNAFFIFIVQASHRKERKLDAMLNMIAPGCEIIEVDRVTDGAACTVLLSENYIDDAHELIIANSDQLVDTDIKDFVRAMRHRQARGGMMTFRSVHPKWSFARLNENSWVTEVKEKEPISDVATVGIYYFKHGCDYVAAAKSMIDQNDRTNGEFYVAPVYNHLIKMIDTGEAGNYIGEEENLNGIATWDIDFTSMIGLGTPEDLQAYLQRRNADPEYKKEHP